MTTSTRCSRVRGPATLPSFVTCPTRIVVMPRCLAARMRDTCDLTNLCHSAGCAIYFACGDCLNRIDNDESRLYLVDVSEHCGEVGLRGKHELLVERSDSFCAHPSPERPTPHR